jgi:hypothetical protein
MAGYAREHFEVEPPQANAPQLVHQAYYYGVLASGLRAATARHPEWTTTTHEALCIDSHARFAALAAALGLEWGADASRYLDASNDDGSGYRTVRRTEDQPDRWRERLDDEQVATIRETLAPFPTALLPD